MGLVAYDARGASPVIQQGLVMLVQAGLAASPPPFAGGPVPGGFADYLPENQAPPAYIHRGISSVPQTGLQFVRGLVAKRIDIVSFGTNAAQAQLLAKAIHGIVNGFKGTLSDPDATVVDSIIYQDDEGPKYSDSARNWYYMFEYRIWFYQTF